MRPLSYKANKRVNRGQNALQRPAEHTTHLFWVMTGSDHQANSLTSKFFAAKCADDGKSITDALEDVASGGVTKKALGWSARLDSVGVV